MNHQLSSEMRASVEALRQNILKVSSTHRPRILIVEDDSQDGELLRRQIEQQCVPAEIVSVRSCESAIHLLREDQFDLVFLDLKFPGMSGVELLEAIGSETERIPFIVMSGAAEEGSMMRDALLNGARAIFRKEPEYPMLAGICGAL